MPQESSNHTCLAVISFDSDFKKDENFYPQVFFERMRIHWRKSDYTYYTYFSCFLVYVLLTHKYAYKVEIVKKLCGLVVRTR